MYKISKLNHHNTNSLKVIPGMTAIRFDDGLATTTHQCHIHVPQTCNMRCVIPFHPSIRYSCTRKSSYIGKSPSPNHTTDDIPITLNWIKVRRFGWPSHELAKGSKSCVRYERSHHLATVHTPVVSKSLRFV